MKNPLPARLLLLLLTVSCLSLIALSCGDDDEPSEEEYFTSLETILTDFAGVSDSLRSEYPASFLEKDATNDYYAALLDEMGNAFEEIDDLDPPLTVEPQHTALADAAQNFMAEVSRVNAEVEALESSAAFIEFVGELQTDPQLTIARNALRDACLLLQNIADDQGFDVDLLCGEAPNPAEDAVLSQYFSAVKGIFDEADEATAEAEAELDSAASDATFEEQKDAVDNYLTEIERIFANTLNRLRSLAAPDPVADAQADFVDAVEDMIDSAEAFQQNLPNIADAEHLDTRRTDFGEEIAAAVQRANAACEELQRIADGREIDVDLDCAA